jgi:hypothetical protein
MCGVAREALIAAWVGLRLAALTVAGDRGGEAFVVAHVELPVVGSDAFALGDSVAVVGCAQHPVVQTHACAYQSALRKEYKITLIHVRRRRYCSDCSLYFKRDMATTQVVQFLYKIGALSIEQHSHKI